MRFAPVHTAEELAALVNEVGFLPFFENHIEGFSVEECTPPELWFADDIDGPWEWKGPVIHLSGCAYGKFFLKKAGFVSAEWFPDFANYRRDGYDFDARFDDELASFKDKRLIDILEKTGPILSRGLKKEGDYGKNGVKGFDTVITRLQMQCYVLISDFIYETDKNGKEYGWGVGRYATPEQNFGSSFTDRVYKRRPEESFEKILGHLKTLLPDVDVKAIKKILK